MIGFSEIFQIVHVLAFALMTGGGAALIFVFCASDRSPDPWLAARPASAAALWLWAPSALVVPLAGWAAGAGGARSLASFWVLASALVWIIGAAALATGFHQARLAARDGRPPASIVPGRKHRSRRNLLFWIGGAALALAVPLMVLRPAL